MKTFIITCLLALNFNLAFSQETDRVHYKIQYHFLVEKSPVKLEDDSIKIIYRDAEEEKVISKIPLQVTPRFDINFYYTCVGDWDSSKLFLNNNLNRDDASIIKKPKTAVYYNKSWYEEKITEESKIPIEPVSFELLDEYKTILGYRCQLIKGRFLETNKLFNLWFSPSLPPTLMPFIGLVQFPGAILEFEIPENNSSFKAIEIVKL